MWSTLNPSYEQTFFNSKEGKTIIHIKTNEINKIIGVTLYLVEENADDTKEYYLSFSDFKRSINNQYLFESQNFDLYKKVLKNGETNTAIETADIYFMLYQYDDSLPSSDLKNSNQTIWYYMSFSSSKLKINYEILVNSWSLKYSLPSFIFCILFSLFISLLSLFLFFKKNSQILDNFNVLTIGLNISILLSFLGIPFVFLILLYQDIDYINNRNSALNVNIFFAILSFVILLFALLLHFHLLIRANKRLRTRKQYSKCKLSLFSLLQLLSIGIFASGLVMYALSIDFLIKIAFIFVSFYWLLEIASNLFEAQPGTSFNSYYHLTICVSLVCFNWAQYFGILNFNLNQYDKDYKHIMNDAILASFASVFFCTFCLVQRLFGNCFFFSKNFLKTKKSGENLKTNSENLVEKTPLGSEYEDLSNLQKMQNDVTFSGKENNKNLFKNDSKKDDSQSQEKNSSKDTRIRVISIALGLLYLVGVVVMIVIRVKIGK